MICISKREFLYGIVSTSRANLGVVDQLVSYLAALLLDEWCINKTRVCLLEITRQLVAGDRILIHEGDLPLLIEVEGIGNEESCIRREGVDQVVNFSSSHVCHPFIHLRHTVCFGKVKAGNVRVHVVSDKFFKRLVQSKSTLNPEVVAIEEVLLSSVGFHNVMVAKLQNVAIINNSKCFCHLL